MHVGCFTWQVQLSEGVNARLFTNAELSVQRLKICRGWFCVAWASPSLRCQAYLQPASRPCARYRGQTTLASLSVLPTTKKPTQAPRLPISHKDTMLAQPTAKRWGGRGGREKALFKLIEVAALTLGPFSHISYLSTFTVCGMTIHGAAAVASWD